MEIKKLVRKNILELKPYTSARDIKNTGILLDANENSIGSAAENFNELKLNRYPDPQQNDLKEAVGSYFSIKKENLFFGVGSDEIIDLLIRIFCESGKDEVLIPSPTYGMYKVCCDINGIKRRDILLNKDFQIDFEEISKNRNDNVKIIFLCSPNNPTGNLFRREDILTLCKKYNSIIIVDEAYIEFASGGSLINEINNYKNLVVLRTFSKAWGLAGIRLGFAAANKEIIDLLFKVKAPYNINSLTRFIVKKGVENFRKKEKFVEQIVKERERLKNLLEGLIEVKKVFDSDTNFLLVKFENSKKIMDKLLKAGIIIRDRSTEPMLDNCLRISIGTPEENDLLWETLNN